MRKWDCIECFPFQFFASVVCGSGTASSASHFKLCLQPFWQAVSLKSSHERKLGTWLLSGKGCFGSRLEHLYSSVVNGPSTVTLDSGKHAEQTVSLAEGLHTTVDGMQIRD